MTPALAATLALAASAPEPSFVDLALLAPGAVIDMRYATADNFTGAPVDGYEAGRCLLATPAAEALARVEARLETMGLRLRVHDCYRPQRAVDAFGRWAAAPEDAGAKAVWHPDTPKNELFSRGYIASRSGHSRGATVDLTIDGLDMGSPWDFFGEISHVAAQAAPPQARANRLLLRALMISEGFRPYDLEWWHFTLEDEPYADRYFDFPVRPADAE